MEAQLVGGESDGMTAADIAKKHNVPLCDIMREFKIGKKMEMEHTNDPKIAEKIARDHLSEFKNYYSKLTKMEKSLKESTLVETTLEDLAVFEEWDTGENIQLLHEMEYKIHQIIENKWAVHPKLFKNVLVRFAAIALEAYTILENQFERLFEYWQSNHNIDSPEEFADMVIKDQEESYGDNWVDYANKKGVSRGMLHLEPSDVSTGVSSDVVYQILRDEAASGYQAYEAYTWAMKGFLEENGVEFPDDADEEEFATEYIVEHDLEDEFMVYLSKTYTLEDLFGEPALTEDMWRSAIETKLYNDYMANFGYDIPSVHEEIEEHKARVENIDTDHVAELIDNLKTASPDSDDIDEVAKTLYANGVAPMLRTISLAMNIDHLNGNISKDYGVYAGMNLDPSFYDKFHERSVEDWNKELKSIIKPKRQ